MQPERGIRHTRTLMDMLGGNPSIYMSVLGNSFQYTENNSLETEALDEYAIASPETAYEDLGQQEPT